MESFRIAFDNYCAYLPPAIGHWGLLHDSRAHQAIARELVARLPDVTLLALPGDPAAVSAFARTYRKDPQVGLLHSW